MNNIDYLIYKKGFNPDFSEILLKVIKDDVVEYKHYFIILALCKQYYLPIVNNHSYIIGAFSDLLDSDSKNSFLIIMILHIFKKSIVSDKQMKKYFRDYVINNPKLEIFQNLNHLSKLTLNYNCKWFNIVKKWFDLVRESNEYIYCNSCDSLMVPVFSKSDSFICSNPACENVSERYHNHCWSCGSAIDSKYDSLCITCGWYICSECNECRPTKFGGCSKQVSTGTITKYKPYSSLNEISKFLDDLFINNIIKFNKLENSKIYSGKYITNNCNRGKKILSSDEELVTYLALYLPYHTIKLNSALSNIEFEAIYKTPTTVWDWGCGQAIGSLVFFEHIDKLDYNLQIERVVLIEPSSLAINAGKTLLNFCFQSNNKYSPIVDLIQTDFDHLNNNDLKIDSENVNFHILSNILDVTAYDLDRFIDFIVSNFNQSINYFICTGPNYPMCIDRIEHFHNGVSSKCRTYLIKEDSTAIKAGVYNSKRKKILKKYITKYEKIFKTKIENYN